MKLIMGRPNRSKVLILKPIFSKFVKFIMLLCGCSPGKCWIFPSFSAFLMFGSLACFFVVMGSSLLSLFPSSVSTIEPNRKHDLKIKNNGSLREACNVFDGDWVMDESYPLYNASLCPFLEQGFDCLSNGRKDKEYLKWRWKPKSCEIPRFDVEAILKWLRGKRIVFVGDSLSRTQWESMICMLMRGITDKTTVYEVHGNEITKQIRHLSVRFRSYNFTLEFYRSVFLVRPGPVPRQSPKRVKMVLKLDQMDSISREWIDSDVLVFNSGHWWSTTKLFEMGWYFQIGGRIKLGMRIGTAFQLALSTWRSWMSNSIDPRRTQVFFRTFESSHWSGGRENCKVTRQPSHKDIWRQESWISDAIIAAVKNVSVPVKLLHVTPMGAFRSDGHVGSWSDTPWVPDCSHWCLPGVPDMWNELLFSYLLPEHRDLVQSSNQ